MRRFANIVLGLLTFGMGVSPAVAADIKIENVQAFLFLEQAGKLSDDIADATPLTNLPRGGATGDDSATGVLLEFTFSGDKNSRPKYATATVDITQSGYARQPIVTHKAFANFTFGADGMTHKAVFMENATCLTLQIEVHAGKSTKDAKLVFQCPQDTGKTGL